jgi:hypothetical protein
MPGPLPRFLSNRPVTDQIGCWAGLLLVVVLCWLTGSCNKNSNASGNKAYLSVTNASPGSPPMDVFFEGNKLNTGGSIPFGATTGFPGDPYDTAIAGVHSIKVSSGDTSYLTGYIDMGLYQNYSIFIYDTLSASGKLEALILKDGFVVPPKDTLAASRFLNFSPDTLLLVEFTNVVDTVRWGGIPYVGPNPNPAGLSKFQNLLPRGSYGVTVWQDSTHFVNLDSVSILQGKCYSIYMTGLFGGSGSNALGIHSIQHN